ncbi:MAG: hypothetical protein MUE56_03530 [Ignavibacteria bacterium]|jgi:hypothetical protein|nr:hypothetical protein [Ignavibacteria bacterium]
MKQHYLIIILAVLFLQFTGCSKIINMITGKNADKEKTDQTELEKRKKEIELRERELALEKEKMNLEKERTNSAEENSTGTSESNGETAEKTEKTPGGINLSNFATLWWGTIRDGTDWEVSIVNFDGKNFKGRNTIYWKTTPDGFSTNFTGTIDNETGKVVMYEDKNAKGSGKFTGTINRNGNRMSGSWLRYSDGTSFKWNLEKMEKGAE